MSNSEYAPPSHAYELDHNGNAVCIEDGEAREPPKWSGLNPTTAGARMRVNGETPELIEWMSRELKSNRDTSLDEDFEFEHSSAWVDKYLNFVLYTTIVPKALAMGVPLLLAAMPVTATMTLFGLTLPDRAWVPDRTARKFKLIFHAIGPLLALPFTALAFASLMYDYMCYYAFGIPLWLARGAPSRAQSLETLRPFRNGPAIWAYPTDILLCILGQVQRNGMGATALWQRRALGWLEVAAHMVVTVLYAPMSKYWLNANPWASEVRHRFITQISTTVKDLPLDIRRATGERLITQCNPGHDVTNAVDKWNFVPHYPLPPSDRRWVVGSQQVVRSVYFLTHTLHLDDTDTVLSRDATVKGFRVVLWYNNPYHAYTGFVEANASTGGTQTDKPDSYEHPMWLCSGTTPSLAHGGAEIVFDTWLPTFVHTIRCINFGLKYADKHSATVISKHGRSRPAQPCNVLPTKHKRE